MFSFNFLRVDNTRSQLTALVSLESMLRRKKKTVENTVLFVQVDGCNVTDVLKTRWNSFVCYFSRPDAKSVDI